MTNDPVPRPFDLVAQQRAIDAVLAQCPEGTTKAVVGYLDTEGRGKVGIVVKIDDTWRVQGALSADLKARKVAGDVTVLGAWK